MPNSWTIQNLFLDFCTSFFLFKMSNLIPSISLIPILQDTVNALLSCYPVNITLKPVPNFQLALASVLVCVGWGGRREKYREVDLAKGIDSCDCEGACPKFSGYTSRLETQGRVQRSWLAEFFLSQGTSIFVLSRPSIYWMKPYHILKGSQL